jgi:thiol-disulfide isomerase/thioredoxin
MSSKTWLIVGLALLAGIATSLYMRSVTEDEETEFILPASTELADLDGNLQPLRQWQGKVLLINFWATWCPPCLEEIPLFSSLRKQYAAAGFEVVGVAVDEISKVIEFRDAHQVEFPLLNGEQDGMSMMSIFGNAMGGLPYSVLFDRNGTAVHYKTGSYSRQELQDLIEKYL